MEYGRSSRGGVGPRRTMDDVRAVGHGLDDYAGVPGSASTEPGNSADRAPVRSLERKWRRVFQGHRARSRGPDARTTSAGHRLDFHPGSAFSRSTMNAEAAK